MNDKLLPCPQGHTQIRLVDDDGVFRWYECECGWSGPADLGESGAAENWNHRVYPPEIQAVIDAAIRWELTEYDTSDTPDACDGLLDAVRKYKALLERES